MILNTTVIILSNSFSGKNDYLKLIRGLAAHVALKDNLF